jgi:hypothetical protein
MTWSFLLGITTFSLFKYIFLMKRGLKELIKAFCYKAVCFTYYLFSRMTYSNCLYALYWDHRLWILINTANRVYSSRNLIRFFPLPCTCLKSNVDPKVFFKGSWKREKWEVGKESNVKIWCRTAAIEVYVQFEHAVFQFSACNSNMNRQLLWN